MKSFAAFVLGLAVGIALVSCAVMIRQAAGPFQLVRVNDLNVMRLNTLTGETWEQDGVGGWLAQRDVTNRVASSASR